MSIGISNLKRFCGCANYTDKATLRVIRRMWVGRGVKNHEDMANEMHVPIGYPDLIFSYFPHEFTEHRIFMLFQKKRPNGPKKTIHMDTKIGNRLCFSNHFFSTVRS